MLRDGLQVGEAPKCPDGHDAGEDALKGDVVGEGHRSYGRIGRFGGQRAAAGREVVSALEIVGQLRGHDQEEAVHGF